MTDELETLATEPPARRRTSRCASSRCMTASPPTPRARCHPGCVRRCDGAPDDRRQGPRDRRSRLVPARPGPVPAELLPPGRIAPVRSRHGVGPTLGSVTHSSSLRTGGRLDGRTGSAPWTSARAPTVPTGRSGVSGERDIGFARAREIVAEHVIATEPEAVALADAVGRRLAVAVTARADHPPFTNSSMDGWALSAGADPGAPAGRR